MPHVEVADAKNFDIEIILIVRKFRSPLAVYDWSIW